jgi:hypothetical protein
VNKKRKKKIKQKEKYYRRAGSKLVPLTKISCSTNVAMEALILASRDKMPI